VAVPTPSNGGSGAETASFTRLDAIPASVVLAAAIPFLFFHIDFQPGFTVELGSLSAHAVLSDFAVLAVAVVALVVGIRHGFEPLRAGWPVWVAGGLFCLLVGAASLYPRIWDGAYDVSTHAVTAAKFGEYALLAPAVPLLLRGARDLELVLAALVVWAGAAAIVGVLQIFGVDIFDAWSPGRRQPSFLGHYDLAALCGAALLFALTVLALGSDSGLPRWLLVTAAAGGAVGVTVSGSAAAGLGLAAATAGVLIVAGYRRRLTVRRALASLAVVGAVAVGILVMRGGDVDQFVRFLGIREHDPSAQENVQTYVQRTMLAYIGWQVFLDHPIAGAGWQSSAKEEQVYGDYLDDARREFPKTPKEAFPTQERPYGIQNAYVQALADLGVIGFALLLVTFAAGLFLAARAALRGPPESLLAGVLAGSWLLLVMGTWTAVGLVAGVPLDALTWIALGLAAAVAAGARLGRA
jgi:O-antigen ligase